MSQPAEGTKDPGSPALTTAAYLNSFKSLVPHARSTGLRTAQLKFNSFPEDRRDLAAEFLLNSRYRRGDREFELSVRAYFEDPAMAMVSRVGERNTGEARPIPLPPPLALPMALQQAIVRRRSQRQLSGEALPLDRLATLLQCGGGVTAFATTELSTGAQCRMPLRAAPSGGGLYPIDLYFAAAKVPGLEGGVYRFLNRESAVLPLRVAEAGKTFEQLCAALPGPVNASLAAAVLVLAIRPWRSARKYGTRGLRFGLMEAGYLSENIHLAATALGVPSCDHGGFHDDEVNQVFGLDGANETAIHVILMGG